MNITLHIEAANPAELQEAIAGLAGITGGSTPVQTEKPKQTRAKAEKQPDPKPEEKPKQEEPAEEPEEPNLSEPAPTVVELRAAAREKGESVEGKEAIRELLEEFNSKSISGIPESRRAEFLKRLEAL